MSLPPLLLGAATAFWGLEAGTALVAAALALAVEGRGAVSRRWALSAKQFASISDLSAVGFLAMTVFLYSTREPSAAFSNLSVYLPLMFAPLLVAQTYSERGAIPLSALFVFLRKRPEPWARTEVDLGPPFFILCLLSAGAANERAFAFYAGLFWLCAWALCRHRRPGTTPAAWAALMALAGALGWAGQLGLHRLQSLLEEGASRLVFGLSGPRPDPYQSAAALGHIGLLKLSNGIVLRAAALGGARMPGLLRAAAYDHFAGTRWHARNALFKPLPAGGDGRSWGPSGAPSAQGTSPSRGAVRVSMSLPRGTGLLVAPQGAASVHELPAARVSRSPLGTLKVEEGPGLACYRADLGGAEADGPPGPVDLQLPPADAALLRGLAAELKLDAKRPRLAMETLERFFQERFAYTLYREGPAPREPLREFLLETRAGHCEHFATATVLLLRAAGIPARYATGYAMTEYSRLEGAYVARGRHAHAWTLARDGSRWAELDTTPASWASAEGARRPVHEPLSDLWAWAAHRASRWWWSESRERKWLVWALLALTAVLAWRLGRGFGRAAAREAARSLAARPAAGSDSELYAVERGLAAAGLGRHPWETFPAWIDRLAAAGAPAPLEALRRAAALHERYRFDPRGLSPQERSALREAAAACRAQGR